MGIYGYGYWATILNFRVVSNLSRNEKVSKKFIKKFVYAGNTIVSNQFPGYNLLDMRNSGYNNLSFNHRNTSFEAGLGSSSHIEAIWHILKSKIRNAYYVIPKTIYLLL